MVRKLILTEHEVSSLESMHSPLNDYPLGEGKEPIDITHLIFSLLSLSGVDRIYSPRPILCSQTKLLSQYSHNYSNKKWRDIDQKVQEIFDKYTLPTSGCLKSLRRAIAHSNSHTISYLLFAMNENAAVMHSFDFRPNTLEGLRPELAVPLRHVLTSVQSQSADLPVINGKIEKKDMIRLVKVLESKEFTNYKEAQSLIELNKKLTSNTARKIETAGKELYKKNGRLFLLKNAVIQAIPLTTKVIDLFFGKLPGILSDFAGNIATNYLNNSSAIPVHDCHAVFSEQLRKRYNE